jgi:general secretion pathway protein K
MMQLSGLRRRRQQGVAVVTALLLTTLAITIVASLFWQQQVQVRSIENQRFQLQKKWVLLGAIDWARLILREDAKNSNVDYIGEPWSVGLQETRLSDYLENGEDTDGSDASLSGQITDAQSRFNLTNLAQDGVVNPAQIQAFGRLLAALHFDVSLAPVVAQNIAATQAKKPPANVNAAASASSSTANTANSANDTAPAADPAVQFLRFNQSDDLLAVNGFNSAMVEKLKDYVTVLPKPSAINVNTASPEVLTALFPAISLSDAAAMATSRERAYFKDKADFQQRFSANMAGVKDADWDVKTAYFIVHGVVKLNRSELATDALIERSGLLTKVIWIRES